ncbi:hypothetical protein ALC57_16284, partial [Trachymyrmex cornetzi]
VRSFLVPADPPIRPGRVTTLEMAPPSFSAGHS